MNQVCLFLSFEVVGSCPGREVSCSARYEERMVCVKQNEPTQCLPLHGPSGFLRCSLYSAAAQLARLEQCSPST